MKQNAHLSGNYTDSRGDGKQVSDDNKIPGVRVSSLAKAVQALQISPGKSHSPDQVVRETLRNHHVSDSSQGSGKQEIESDRVGDSLCITTTQRKKGCEKNSPDISLREQCRSRSASSLQTNDVHNLKSNVTTKQNSRNINVDESSSNRELSTDQRPVQGKKHIINIPVSRRLISHALGIQIPKAINETSENKSSKQSRTSILRPSTNNDKISISEMSWKEEVPTRRRWCDDEEEHN